jgi:hypothetical protein
MIVSLPEQLESGAVLEGPVLPEPVRLVLATRVGDRIRLAGAGLRTGRFLEVLLDADQVRELRISAAEEIALVFAGVPSHGRSRAAVAREPNAEGGPTAHSGRALYPSTARAVGRAAA